MQTALFASWFTFGLSAIFWFYMNSGRWFSSPKKFALSAVNLLALAVGCCLVCISSTDPDQSTHIYSAVLGSMSPERPSTMIPTMPVSPA